MKGYCRIIRFVLMVVMMVTLTNCTDWLDLEPENDLIEDEFWRKGEDVEAMLAATYNSFRSNTLNNLMMGEIRGDLLKFNGSAFWEYNRIAQSDITTTNSVINWGGYYNTINLANTLLHYAPLVMERDPTFKLEHKEAIDAEALFIRSLSYFYLVRLWKDVPLVTNPMISDTVSIFLPKSSEHKVLDRIVMDLKKAEEIAWKDEFIDNPVFYKGRANLYSIWALLADVYLWKENYTECINYCDKIIGSRKFSLEAQNDWFSQFYPGNSMNESIFEVQYSAAFKQTNPVFYNVVVLRGSNPTMNMVATDALSRLFDLADIRKMNPQIDDSQPAIPARKYAGKDISSAYRVPTENDANFIIYRYAEILLMKAEALVELGQAQAANVILQEVSDRSNGMYDPKFEIEDLRTAVLNERAREFSGEGKRWFDVLRYSKRNGFMRKQFIINMVLAKASVQQRAILETRVTDTMSYFLPIPENEIMFNQELIQNPYYDR